MQTHLKQLTTFSLALTLNISFINFPRIQDAKALPITGQLEVAQYSPPGNMGAPSSTAGGGSRNPGNCPQDTKATAPFTTPLKPDSSLAYGVSLTVSERPEFFIYLPKSNAETAEFVLKDEEEKDVYRQNLSISGKSGVMGFKLPKDAPSLALGKNYHWYLSVICNSQNRRQDIFVDGLIRRVEVPTDLATKLQGATESDRYKLYAEAGIWQDAIAQLVELRRQKPEDTTLAEAWKKLLESAGIKQIGDIPFTLTQL